MSAVLHRRISAPGAHVEWVPLEIRSGSRSLHTGPSETRAASRTTQYDASSFMSVVNVTRYPSSSPALPTRGAMAVSLPKTLSPKANRSSVPVWRSCLTRPSKRNHAGLPVAAYA